MTQKSRIFLSLICYSVLCLLISCEEGGRDISPRKEVQKTGPFFDQRYCEVLLAKLDPTTGISLEAYNTIGCSNCPEEEWTTLDPDTLKEELNSPYVRLNGPRHWVLDSISSSTTTASCDTSFGELEMSLVATIPITLDDISTEIAYKVSSVARNTAWYFYKGRQVYVLEDSTGKCFVMQSYSQKIDSNLQLEELETLGSRLDLPPGWSYRALILEEDFVLESQNGFAELVSDELENAYQYLNDGCL